MMTRFGVVTTAAMIGPPLCKEVQVSCQPSWRGQCAVADWWPSGQVVTDGPSAGSESVGALWGSWEHYGAAVMMRSPF
jgi:hypothetical protein